MQNHANPLSRTVNPLAYAFAGSNPALPTPGEGAASASQRHCDRERHHVQAPRAVSIGDSQLPNVCNLHPSGEATPKSSTPIFTNPETHRATKFAA
jgi:hypothetical protein